MPKKSLPVYAISLGCPKNRVDTERLIGSLGPNAKLVPTPGRASLIFINTCAFIEPAARESIRAIIDMTEKIRKLKNRPLLAVAGCLPGRYGTRELEREFPGVDFWLLPEDQENWPHILAEKLPERANVAVDRLLSTGPSYAWLKIADGCNHKCHFCAIPAIRGKYSSEKMEKIVNEARALLSQGISELDIVAQDVLSYGKDLNGQVNLFNLLDHLARLPNLRWLRLLYLYPGLITREFLEKMGSFGKPLLPYLDIPFQHSEKDLLAGMGRPFAVDPWQTVKLIREIIPSAALRATFIVGYPGETDTQFQKLCEFIEKTRFHNVGVFTYHAEMGTKAALLPNQIPEETKEMRKKRIMELQAGISADILAEYVNERMDVLIDRENNLEWPGLHKGRVWFQAPEVDGITYVSGPGVSPGKMKQCEIVDSQTYDLSALAV